MGICDGWFNGSIEIDRWSCGWRGGRLYWWEW